MLDRNELNTASIQYPASYTSVIIYFHTFIGKWKLNSADENFMQN
ncbi:MAG: hypothetical protein AAB116_24165 [Candidatus Poribacteria bacterium]